MDEHNPAVVKHTGIHPALLESVLDDPTAAAPVFRAQAVQQMHELHTLRNNLTPAQRMQLAELAAKLGDMVPKKAEAAGAGGPGFSIQINIPQVGSTPAQSLVIEPAAVADVADVADVEDVG